MSLNLKKLELFKKKKKKNVSKKKEKKIRIIKKFMPEAAKKPDNFRTKTKESSISTIFEKKKNCSSELYLQLSLKYFVILGFILNKFFF